MRAPGAILLVSCYELGHQPFQLAMLLALLRQAGYVPVAVDTAVEELTSEAIAQAHFVAISVPMHTALRLAEPIARSVRQLNPSAHINFYGLYAWLNADYLFDEGLADSVIAGEFEQPLISLARSLEADSRPADGVEARRRSATAAISTPRPWSAIAASRPRSDVVATTARRPGATA